VRLLTTSHAVRTEYDAAALPPACADLGRLEQALWNLARNAARHAPPDSTIVLRADLRDGALVLGVEDAGPGFSGEALARGFERFYRAERDERGTGLGLSIVQSIAQAHGGQAGLENLPSGGGRAWLSVPRGPCRAG
jgi:two-component system, OmpR family, sensor kinase